MREQVSVVLMPALWQLLLLRTRGKLRRSLQRLRSPRRALPTLLVVVLVGLYLVQAMIAISVREPSHPEMFRQFAPLGMLGILLLKLVGVCIDRNKTGTGFRPEEVQHLCGGPFARHQVRLYRVAGHLVSILATSLFAAIFLRFEVRLSVAALVGAFQLMLFTYLVYTAIAVSAVHVTEHSYRRGRGISCVLLGAALVYCAAGAVTSDVASLAALGRHFSANLAGLTQTAFGRVLLLPFFVFAEVMLAPRVFPDLVGWSLAGGLFVLAALGLLLHIDVALQRRSLLRERREYCQTTLPRAGNRTLRDSAADWTTSPCVPWFGGVGPTAWRQLRAVMRVRRGMTWLLVPSAMIGAVAVYAGYDPDQGIAQGILVPITTVAVLTTIFLPGMLPFDFRGDLDNLAVWKLVPIRSSRIVFGQLIVPVTLLSFFQLVVLSPLALRDFVLTRQLILGMAYLIPVNVIIISLENIVFLLYPYRLAEFDMQATVRRIVMLMAKFCALFVAGLAAILASLGLVVLRAAADALGLTGPWMSGWSRPLFFSAQFCAVAGLAAASLWVTNWAYRRYDLVDDRLV